MATQTAGIQQLLAAEKKAAETVAEARKRRVKRLKQAKDEAVSEIESYKAEQDKKHKHLETTILGNKSTNEDNIKMKTEQSISSMTEAFEMNKQSVLEYILTTVQNITPKEHENLR
jgi:V-type H+-transporting ATPase subunit G